MYCLRVFIVVQEHIDYYNVYHDYIIVFVEKHAYTKFPLDWLVYQ